MRNVILVGIVVTVVIVVIFIASIMCIITNTGAVDVVEGDVNLLT